MSDKQDRSLYDDQIATAQSVAGQNTGNEGDTGRDPGGPGEDTGRDPGGSVGNEAQDRDPGGPGEDTGRDPGPQ